MHVILYNIVLELLDLFVVLVKTFHLRRYRGQVWYHGWEVPRMLLLGFTCGAFQSQTNTEKMLYNKSR